MFQYAFLVLRTKHLDCADRCVFQLIESLTFDPRPVEFGDSVWWMERTNCYDGSNNDDYDDDDDNPRTIMKNCLT